MVPGRKQACFYLWPDPGGRLQERMACGTKKIKEGSMEEDGVGRPEDVWEARVIQERFQCLQEPFGVQDTALPYPIVGTFRDAEVPAEGRDVFELPGDPGIDEGYEESQAVGGIGDDDRGEQCVGTAAGAASEGAD